MKQLTCEVCGGNDLLKQDGVFVCQSCGCKYSPDEVKKLMVQISEPVKVQGVNTIGEEIKNIEALIQMGNLKYAEQLLGEIEKKSPRNPYVWLSYAKFIFAKILTNNNNSKDSVITKCNECRNYLDIYYKNALKFAGEEKNKINKEFKVLFDKVATFESTANSKLGGIITRINLGEYGCYEWNSWNDNYDRIFCFCGSDNSLYYLTDYRKSIKREHEYKHKWLHYDGKYTDTTFASFAHKIDNVDSQGNIKYSNDVYVLVGKWRRAGQKPEQVRVVSNECYEWGESNGATVLYKYSGYEDFVKECTYNEPIKIRLNQQNNLVAVDKNGKEFFLKKHDDCGWSNFSKFNNNYQNLPIKGDSTGCYIATSVYGSYDCPEVWTLRRFRDYTLAQTWYGRAFIKTYYAISPILVKWFGNTTWFQNFWKNKLDRMVCNLKNKGFEDKPYDDRKW